MTDTATTPEVTIVPANKASWEDLEAVLGTRGYDPGCWCQRFKIRGSGPMADARIPYLIDLHTRRLSLRR
ncbi:MAG: hypothetical protein MSC30_19475 [Gaiellaceae bacterium MAG52_C11]|nr:hypothetical protein [Candidatus Gaiellasilicea maunaloa]